MSIIWCCLSNLHGNYLHEEDVKTGYPTDTSPPFKFFTTTEALGAADHSQSSSRLVFEAGTSELVRVVGEGERVHVHL